MVSAVAAVKSNKRAILIRGAPVTLPAKGTPPPRATGLGDTVKLVIEIGELPPVLPVLPLVSGVDSAGWAVGLAVGTTAAAPFTDLVMSTCVMVVLVDRLTNRNRSLIEAAPGF